MKIVESFGKFSPDRYKNENILKKEFPNIEFCESYNRDLGYRIKYWKVKYKGYDIDFIKPSNFYDESSRKNKMHININNVYSITINIEMITTKMVDKLIEKYQLKLSNDTRIKNEISDLEEDEMLFQDLLDIGEISNFQIEKKSTSLVVYFTVDFLHINQENSLSKNSYILSEIYKTIGQLIGRIKSMYTVDPYLLVGPFDPKGSAKMFYRDWRLEFKFKDDYAPARNMTHKYY